jgi:hypothetical protein
LTDQTLETTLNTPSAGVDKAPALDSYTPMPDPVAEEPKKKTYGDDIDSIKSAAKDLSEARSEGRVPKAESEEPITDRGYINYATGEPVETNQTLDPLRAARDLTAVRDYEVAKQQTPPAEAAAAIDQLAATARTAASAADRAAATSAAGPG